MIWYHLHNPWHSHHSVTKSLNHCHLMNETNRVHCVTMAMFLLWSLSCLRGLSKFSVWYLFSNEFELQLLKYKLQTIYIHSNIQLCSNRSTYQPYLIYPSSTTCTTYISSILWVFITFPFWPLYTITSKLSIWSCQNWFLLLGPFLLIKKKIGQKMKWIVLDESHLMNGGIVCYVSKYLSI